MEKNSSWLQKANSLTEAIEKASNEPSRALTLQESNSDSDEDPPIQEKHRSRTQAKGLFLTETEVNTREKKRERTAITAPKGTTYEDLLREVDGMIDGFKEGGDDLADLRRRIDWCGREIEVHTAFTENVNKTVKAIGESTRGIEQKMKNRALVKKY